MLTKLSVCCFCRHSTPLPQVVERLLRPAAKVPTNPWETFMLSLSDGDVSGMWMVVSGKAALFSAPVVLAALATHLATGEPTSPCFYMDS